MEFRNTEHHVAPSPAPAAHTPVKARRGLSMAKLQKQLMMWLVVAILFIIAIGTAAYYVHRYNDSQKQVKKLSNPTAAAQLEQTQLISKIGALTVLPTNETPTVATVTDITKLKDQAFFANAQNGDKVLIYTKAKKAYLYRPSTNKIINIAPVNLGNGTGTTATTPTTTTKTTR
jgi:hypothetical protein